MDLNLNQNIQDKNYGKKSLSKKRTDIPTNLPPPSWAASNKTRVSKQKKRKQNWGYSDFNDSNNNKKNSWQTLDN